VIAVMDRGRLRVRIVAMLIVFRPTIPVLARFRPA
jgi:hypothetical protein